MAIMPACAPGPDDFSGYRNIDPHGWVYGDTISFVPALTDSVASGSLTLMLRHTGSYLYSNLWIELQRHGADTVMVDTFNIQVADIYGRWLGTGPGVAFQLTDTLMPSVTLTRGDTLVLRHIMRSDTLPDIEQIGLAFSRTD